MPFIRDLDKITFEICKYDEDEYDEPLYTKATSKYQELVPNLNNFNTAFKISGHAGLGYTEDESRIIDITLSHNGEPNEHTELDYYCNGNIHIVYRDNSRIAHNLTKLSAYALSENGIYYAYKDGTIWFLGNDNRKEIIGKRRPNVTGMKYINNTLILVYVKNYEQIASHAYRDTLGYMYEEYYDVYKVFVEREIIGLSK